MWDGTGWDFCTQDDSFISTRIVKRHSLEVKEQRTELTWKFHGEKKTYRTWFIVVEDENILDDIMLGKNWENVENQTRVGPQSQSYGQEAEQPLGMNTRKSSLLLEYLEIEDTNVNSQHMKSTLRYSKSFWTQPTRSLGRIIWLNWKPAWRV